MSKEIFFSKHINQESIAGLISEIGEEKEATIFLNSTGGLSIEAIAFFNYIKAKKINMTINVIGECESAAIIMLCAGDKRIGSRFSSFLLHRLRRTYEGKFSFTVEELAHESQELASCEQMLQKIVAETTKMSLEKLIPIYEAEKNLTPQKAFELGLLTEEPY